MGTAFYAFGLGLTAAALIFSFLGLRMKTFPAGPAFAAVIAVFLVLVGGTATFAVAFSEEEQEHREKELAEEEAAALESEDAPGEGEAAGGGTEDSPGSDSPEEVEAGPGSEVELAAEESELLFDQTALSATVGEVTINLDNPSSIPHNVAILDGQEQLAISDTVSQDQTSASAELEPGDYTFICTIPGHSETMQGVLTVE